MGDMADDARERAEMYGLARRLRAAGVDDPSAPYVAANRRPPWRADPEPGLERFGGEPPVGTVLRWRLERDGTTWTMTGLRVGPGWFLSTNHHTGPVSWSVVAGLIGDRPCDVAVAWREIPAPEPDPSGDDAVSAWASRFLPPSIAHPGGGEGADTEHPLDPELRAGNTMAEPGQPPRIADPMDDDQGTGEYIQGVGGRVEVDTRSWPGAERTWRPEFEPAPATGDDLDESRGETR